MFRSFSSKSGDPFYGELLSVVVSVVLVVVVGVKVVGVTAVRTCCEIARVCGRELLVSCYTCTRIIFVKSSVLVVDSRGEACLAASG